MELSYREALNQAMREEMRRDQRIFLMGEDIGHHGGIFRVTKDLIDEFGAERVRVLARRAVLRPRSASWKTRPS